MQVRPIAEDEMFRVLRTGKRKSRPLPVSLQFVPSECYLFVVVSPSIRSKFTCRLSVFLVYSHAYQRPSMKFFLSSLIFTHERIAFEHNFIGSCRLGLCVSALRCTFLTVFLQDTNFLIMMWWITAKQWKRLVTKVTFVGPGFTRKPPKYERFIRPMGLRFTKAHITHPELKCTFNLDIIGVKKNPNGPMYTSMGVITKGTVIEVFWFSILQNPLCNALRCQQVYLCSSSLMDKFLSFHLGCSIFLCSKEQWICQIGGKRWEI